MLVQQVLYAVDAETFTLEVGEKHVSVTSLRLAQPSFQNDECGFGDWRTTLLTAFSNYAHVSTGAENDVLVLETGNLG